MAGDLSECGVRDGVAALEREPRQLRKRLGDKRDVRVGRGGVGEVEVGELRVAAAERLQRWP